MLGRLSAQSGPWRIQNHKLRPFFRLLQKLFCVFVMGNDRNTREFRIRLQVARCRKIRVHTHDLPKRLRQRNRKESHSGVQIERQLASRIFDHSLQQIPD